MVLFTSRSKKLVGKFIKELEPLVASQNVYFSVVNQSGEFYIHMLTADVNDINGSPPSDKAMSIANAFETGWNANKR